jgi:two-component system, cell cycle response regulator
MPARIVIVEDNPESLELMSYLLTAHGHAVTGCEKGELGLKAVRRERPDLVLCDIQLPQMDGYEVARNLRLEDGLRDIPRIAITALAMVGDRDKILAAGFHGYIAKPLDPETFVQELEAFLPAAARSSSAVVFERAAAVPPSAPNGRTILILDDDPSNLEVARDVFTLSGYRVLTAGDAASALAIATEEQPDVILADVCMQGENGYDFIKSVKQSPRLTGVPFVFISSIETRPAERARGLALGARKFLFRPIDPADLLREVADLF